MNDDLKSLGERIERAQQKADKQGLSYAEMAGGSKPEPGASILGLSALLVSFFSAAFAYEAAEATRQQAELARNAIRDQSRTSGFGEYLALATQLCEASGALPVLDTRHGYRTELRLGYAAYLPNAVGGMNQKDYEEHNDNVIQLLSKLKTVEDKWSIWLDPIDSKIVHIYSRVFGLTRLMLDRGTKSLRLQSLENESLCYANKEELSRWFKSNGESAPIFLSPSNIRLLPIALNREIDPKADLERWGFSGDYKYYGTLIEMFDADASIGIPFSGQPKIIPEFGNQARVLKLSVPKQRR
ncbi:hypothetical protein ELH05_24920 [Rhizobium ruizarguesonis]|uniref:hypothetical protein n=1 Tax=Rhizobium ruizarguesonis TaxID=2081791 RepID=UPI001031376E|nr:hypothetical protein [Rhizobium ruizarguesonis]TBE30848.1 hypothetical protein ELH05_24920 [Rhizobium ruizarguesonis]